MKTKEELCSNIIEFLKLNDHYNFYDFYESEDKAYDNFYDLLSKNVQGPLTEIGEELHAMLYYDDLRNPELKKRYDMGMNLVYDLNVYYNGTLEANKDLDIT